MLTTGTGRVIDMSMGCAGNAGQAAGLDGDGDCDVYCPRKRGQRRQLNILGGGMSGAERSGLGVEVPQNARLGRVIRRLAPGYQCCYHAAGANQEQLCNFHFRLLNIGRKRPGNGRSRGEIIRLRSPLCKNDSLVCA